MEYINMTEVSPLISKCQVKVCYVGQKPNRNGTVITKDVAREMGRKLPGSPVVGYYNKVDKDFEGHNREIVVGSKFEVIDTTRPYGFVPSDARVWFEKFTDDGVEHEYLVTECYIWTGAYPEAQRVINQGNNQSMELNPENSNGFWSDSDNLGESFFIYNEALIEKLCILGENVEPCFEGAQFKTVFSLEDNEFFQEFKNTMFSMITELQESFKKGGSEDMSDTTENKDVTTPGEEFEKKQDTPVDEKKEEKVEDEKKENHACNKDDDDKKKYNLDEVAEYTELKAQYDNLQASYSALEQEKATLENENATLREFKVQAERKSKQDMIDSFYMLNDADKKDVIENIDTYSVEDIEAKLSVICVRNKVNFNLETEEKKVEQAPDGLFNLTNTDTDDAPAWIKAVRATAAIENN